MVKGLYTAYSGMLNEQNRLDVISNNMANATTIGYKKEGATTQSFDDVYAAKIKDASSYFVNERLGSVNLGAKIGETYTDYSQGSMEITDNPYDLALDGDGFFAIYYTNQAEEQSVKYTRDGSFTINNEGYLVTKDGDFVLGTDNNPIQVDTNTDVTIDQLGNIYEDGENTGQLLITDVEDYDSLSKYGENLYDLEEDGTLTESDAKVHQGYLEASNVNIVSEMVSMIEITRAYEANQKVIKTIDTTLEKAVNQVGKV